MAGRKTRLTTELIDELYTYIGNGLSEKDAYSLAGIGHTAFYQWKKQGESDIENGKTTTIYAEFAEKLKKADCAFKQTHLKNISKASQDDWKASAWILERKYPNEFGKVIRQQTDEADNQKDDFNRLTDAIERLADKK